jgi:HEAT repeat protein
MRQRFPRKARWAVAVAALAFASFALAAARHVTQRGADLFARLYVIQVCRAPNDEVRLAGARGLRKLGARALPAMADCAREQQVPDDLFIQLASVADASVVDAIAPGLLDGTDERRLAAARALARIGTSEAALALAPGIADLHVDVRGAAVEGLRGHGPETIAEAVVRALASPSMNAEVVGALLVREGLVTVAVGPVLEALASPDLERVANALELARGTFKDHPPGAQHEAALSAALAACVNRLVGPGQILTIETLGELGLQGGVEALVAVVRNRRFSEGARVAALRGLGLRRHDLAMSVLEETLLLPRHPLRTAAAEGLARLGTPQDAARWLGKVEANEYDWEAREFALQAIARTADAALGPRLIGLRRKMDSAALLEGVRLVAARAPQACALACIDAMETAAPDAMPWYDTLLQDLTWHRTTFRFLGSSRDEFEKARAEVVAGWRTWWRKHGDRSVEAWKAEGLAEMRQDLASPAPDMRLSAIARLIRLDPPDLDELLVERIADTETVVWTTALHALVNRRPAGAAALVLPRLEAKEGWIAARAARTLGILGDTANVDKLLRAAKRPEASVRRDVAYALGRAADRRAIPALLELLAEPALEVRAEAKYALEGLADVSMEPALLAGLSSADPGYVTACAALLGKAGGRASIRPLAALLASREEIVQRTAVAALQTLTGRAPPLAPTEVDLKRWEEIMRNRGR